MSRFAVIIPTLNEGALIGEAVARLTGIEVIVADGESTDDTCAEAERAGARLVVADGGRGAQMNAGAAAARAMHLLFLHADTRLPPDWDRLAADALARPGVVLGAFSLDIADARPAERLIAAGANLRSRLFGMPYGDQALFCSRGTFAALGGFRELPIMEDFDFVRRAKRLGRVALLPRKVHTSPRRWRARGAVKTLFINQAILAGWAAGIAPERLARLYRGTR